MGNLIQDKQAKMQIRWTDYGKVKEIDTLIQGNPSAVLPKLLFRYDATGNRLEKEYTGHYKDIYVRDPQGNVMAVYRIRKDSLYLYEIPMYGSNRLGVIKEKMYLSKKHTQNSTSITSLPVLPLPQLTAFTGKQTVYSFGKKHYESVDWLGNVRVTYTDKKSWQQNKFALSVSSSQDYYPFGAVMEGRGKDFVNYRYGFGKHEKLNELYGEGNAYDMGARLYDPRLGRTPSPDKYKHLYPRISPYAFALNNPIYFLDIDGNIIIDKNGNVVTINRDDKGNITGITATNKKGEAISPDPFTVKMIKAVDKTDIGRQRLNQMEVHTDQFQYLEDKKGSKTGGGPAKTYTTEEKGVLKHSMYINTGYNTEGTRFHNASEEEYLNATGVHEPSHFLNPAQVILDKTQENAENDPNSEYNKSDRDPAFQYTNFETEVLKDELKTREQFPNNTLDQKPSGKETSRERYEKVIYAPKSSDVQKYKPQ